MIIATQSPRPPLDTFIEWLWFHEGLNCDHSLQRVLPDGSMELIFNLRDETRHVFDRVTHRPSKSYQRSWLSGVHSEFIVIDTAPEASMIGAHFRPGGAAAFLRLPPNELRNAVVDLEALWNAAAGTLRDQLLEAPTPAAKFRLLEDALLACRRAERAGHPAVNYALRCFMTEPHSITVGRVTGEIGLSPRRFIQLFNEQVGMTPKLFCRVRRFQKVVAEIHARKRIDWADVAAGCGYYDQAHFIHDFQEFCGLNPTEYLVERIGDSNFVPIRR